MYAIYMTYEGTRIYYLGGSRGGDWAPKSQNQLLADFAELFPDKQSAKSKIRSLSRYTNRTLSWNQIPKMEKIPSADLLLHIKRQEKRIRYFLNKFNRAEAVLSESEED